MINIKDMSAFQLELASNIAKDCLIERYKENELAGLKEMLEAKSTEEIESLYKLFLIHLAIKRSKTKK